MAEEKDELIRKEVKEYYEDVSSGKIRTKVSSESLYDSLGYDRKLLDSLPEEIQMGLSCGNPVDELKVKEGDVILDLGCGSGLDVFMTSMKHPEAKMVYGMDQLQSMIDRAKKVKAKKNFEKTDFRLGKLTDMPFEDSSVDRIISNCVINLEPDKEKVYKEIFRILKDEGTIYISDIILRKDLSEELKNSKNLYGT